MQLLNILLRPDIPRRSLARSLDIILAVAGTGMLHVLFIKVDVAFSLLTGDVVDAALSLILLGATGAVTGGGFGATGGR
jgi:hypothetical protein